MKENCRELPQGGLGICHERTGCTSRDVIFTKRRLGVDGVSLTGAHASEGIHIYKKGSANSFRSEYHIVVKNGIGYVLILVNNVATFHSKNDRQKHLNY